MSEAIDYAKMSEIPVSSCEICVENKPSKKKDAKNKVINKINKDLTQNKKVKFNPFLRLKGFLKSQNQNKKPQKSKSKKIAGSTWLALKLLQYSFWLYQFY